jgi:hypothetical protein
VFGCNVPRQFYCGLNMLIGAPEEIRTPDPQIVVWCSGPCMQFCAVLVGPTQAATLVSERNRSYAARTASLPYRRSSRRTTKCARATSWKWSMNA